ncbi:MAG: ATP-binding protein [Clostridia bacterium]|nr:ATP-binding protein [Clostridia bacterium]
MGVYLNRGNKLFRESAEFSIYIDKTELIKYTNSVIHTPQKYVCVTRPRRFGKSVAANMLTAYYSLGCDSKELFSNLKIAADDSFEKHLNKYNVVHLVMKDFVKSDKSVDYMLSKLYKSLFIDLKNEFKDIGLDFADLADMDLNFIFDSIYQKVHIPFVFIIDEWDCVSRYFKNDAQGIKSYLEFLCTLLKDRDYVDLVYMTGILPIPKESKESSLNMFFESTVTSGNTYYKQYIEEICGFTESEVSELCRKHNRSYDDTRAWYDGYAIADKSIYNPRSVVSYVSTGELKSYWTGTESYEALEQYIRTDADVRNAIVKLLGNELVEIEPLGFENRLAPLENLNDILTALVHLGYLTYADASKSVRIPNYELRDQFRITIEKLGWDNVSSALSRSKELLNATYACNTDKVAEILNAVHDESASILTYNDENSLACAIIIAYYSAFEFYDIRRELPAGKGFADIAYIPKKNRSLPAIIVELKYNKSARTAIDQIKNKHYTEGLAGYSGEVILAGINYDKATKIHTCVIEKVVK